MDWLRPELLLLVGFVIVLGTAFGRLRRDPWSAIALNVGGFGLLIVALEAAASISFEAFLAAGAASLGSVLVTMANYRRGQAGRAPAAGPS